MRFLCLIFVAASASFAQQPADVQLPVDAPFSNVGPFNAKDTLVCGDEEPGDTCDCLKALTWEPTKFPVQLETGKNGADLLIRFPSPKPSGTEKLDNVAVEWHFAREPNGEKKKSALPIVVAHELGSNMAAGKLIAKTFSRLGYHAFMVQLPSYGERRVGRRPRPAEMLKPMQQAIADVRRARDAIVVLPTVDTTHVALQGTSLGGIIAASTGSLDNGFDSVHLVVAGGDLFTMIKTGQRDTASVRRSLERSGITDDELRQMTNPIEPTRIASRLRPDRTWLYSGKSDLVIPRANANALATAAKLEGKHHQWLNANHYTAMLHLPWVVADISANIQKLAARK